MLRVSGCSIRKLGARGPLIEMWGRKRPRVDARPGVRHVAKVFSALPEVTAGTERLSTRRTSSTAQPLPHSREAGDGQRVVIS